jgi:uncharacterized phiE125 gp8 family phage protein
MALEMIRPEIAPRAPLPLVYRRVTPPAAPVIALAQARQHLRLDADDTSEDVLVGAAIAAATAHCDGRDGILNRALVAQAWTASTDRPASHVAGCAAGFVLDFGPVLAVTRIERRLNGVDVALPDGAWRVIPLAGDRTAIVPALPGGWGTADVDPQAWRTTFTAGYGATGEAVPAPIRAAILLMMSDLFETRDAKVGANLVENPTIARLLAPYARVGL